MICLAYALGNEEYGVWGGASARERQRLNGKKKIVSPEIRRDAAALRAEIKRGELKVREIASKHGVDDRTVYRYKRKMKDEGLL
jgi:DNA invertase Pin-like site-specific DNA recombinase